jgi:hypothetical protein
MGYLLAYLFEQVGAQTSSSKRLPSSSDANTIVLLRMRMINPRFTLMGGCARRELGSRRFPIRLTECLVFSFGAFGQESSRSPLLIRPRLASLKR